MVDYTRTSSYNIYFSIIPMNAFCRDASNGDVVGRHSGLWFHTVGQRKGIGLHLFAAHSSRGPWFVKRKNMKNNELWIKSTTASQNCSVDHIRKSLYCELAFS